MSRDKETVPPASSGSETGEQVEALGLRESDAELAAAEHVSAATRGTSALHDTGEEPGQYHVDIQTEDGRTIALEVTSFGGDDWRRTAARVRAELAKGGFSGKQLRQQWWVIFPSGIGLREIETPLTELLLDLERAGHQALTNAYEGDDSRLQEMAAILRDLRVTSVSVWNSEPEEDEQRILLSQSESSVGTAGALTAALEAVFEKRDNQQKLARADVDERHLYVFVEEGGANAVLEGAWPLPPCPSDPEGVIDTVWLYSPSTSAYVFRAQPGEGQWERYTAATGELAPPDAPAADQTQ